MVKLAELLLQRLHHRGTVLVGALREMIRLRLRLVENITRLPPCDFGDVLLPGQELRLLIRLTYRIGRSRLRGGHDRICLRLCALQPTFGLAHQRRCALELYRKHLLELIELVGEHLTIHLDHAGSEQARFGLRQCGLHIVDDVVHRRELLTTMSGRALGGSVRIEGLAQIRQIRHREGRLAGGPCGYGSGLHRLLRSLVVIIGLRNVIGLRFVCHHALFSFFSASPSSGITQSGTMPVTSPP